MVAVARCRHDGCLDVQIRCVCQLLLERLNVKVSAWRWHELVDNKLTISASWRTQSSAESNSSHSEIIAMMPSASSIHSTVNTAQVWKDVRRTETRDGGLVKMESRTQPPLLSLLRNVFFVFLAPSHWKETHPGPPFLPFLSGKWQAHALISFVFRDGNELEHGCR